jgi:hypothetical protein
MQGLKGNKYIQPFLNGLTNHTILGLAVSLSIYIIDKLSPCEAIGGTYDPDLGGFLKDPMHFPKKRGNSIGNASGLLKTKTTTCFICFICFITTVFFKPQVVAVLVFCFCC